MLVKLSVVGYLAMVAGLTGLFFTRSLFSSSPTVIIFQVAATGLILWARVAFGRRSFHAAANPTEGGLVTTGPYRFIRHPIYTAVCLFITAGAAAHLSWRAVLFASLLWLGCIVRMFCEERLVTARYTEYREYALKTARMIPFVF